MNKTRLVMKNPQISNTISILRRTMFHRVYDMLRFHKFTCGSSWISDFGSPEKEEDFKVLLSYSLLHNVKVPEDQNIQVRHIYFPLARWYQ